MSKLPKVISVTAIALLACQGCAALPIMSALPVPSKTSSSPQIEAGWEKTCYADALTKNQGSKISENSENLEVSADKLAEAGKHKEAIGKYNEASAAALNEEIAGGHAETIENYTGDVEGFREENRSLIQKSAELNFKIGQSYIQLGKLESAIDCFDGTLKIGILPPNDAIAHLNRGDAYERMGDKTKAKTDFQQAVALFKKYNQPTYQKISEQRLQAIK
ncbi:MULTISPECIES: tetratricopeptide repeat protein [unclassified Microcoleus]|uniref:tetratricopeptide repeat protein n=1 Tax=unclassified Microcoleus TaxID=2642155 RepID=UPI001DF81AB7|nr:MULTISPECIES: tetratricopeptide repeat protein [unclassified Microcoleus]MCC3473982.1 tetratricopeptide repeat protein [Microcoleus sp. PH2017_13_LAR_U_A]MCC3486064.1 tetratricopeptide repeat protein [Microcoleus sp. PH2017_14_LAR_D_A]MCC3598596.1 tetratricopeptide repeat protein [Microcoleus sp. PH2017_26_ELK_O_A]MCC3623922.1 tetratricopeptide repeat protein [Microcoleus sp. PH2017_36_ELK_O_B]